MRSPYFGIGVHKFQRYLGNILWPPYSIIRNCMTSPRNCSVIINQYAIPIERGGCHWTQILVKDCDHPIISCLFQVDPNIFHRKKSVTPSFSMTPLFERNIPSINIFACSKPPLHFIVHVPYKWYNITQSDLVLCALHLLATCDHPNNNWFEIRQNKEIKHETICE